MCAPSDNKTSKQSGFAHLHLHTDHSILDGGCSVSDIPGRLKELGFTACGISDHGEMGGSLDFLEAMQKEGIKPIIGCEIYLAEKRHNLARGDKTWHLGLIATNRVGMKNLSIITSLAHIESQKMMPGGRWVGVADWDLLAAHSEGIICLSGCMASPVMGEIMKGGSLEIAGRNLDRMIEIFGHENVYGEIQDAGVEVYVPADSEVGELLVSERGRSPERDDDGHEYVVCSQADGNWVLVEKLCKPRNLPYIATGDVHYLRPEDAEPHDVMICIGTGQKVKGLTKRRFSLLPQRYYMRSEDEMRELFKDYPEAVDRTLEIVEKCSDESPFEMGLSMVPKFSIPEEFESSEEYLRHLTMEGLVDRYGEDENEWPDGLNDRVDFELETINSMGYADFFLVLSDWMNWCRDNDIPVGPGRGSAAGSVVSYAMKITALCPLKYGLLFERFLNPDRVSMPDIDVDVAQEDLHKPRDYVREIYNKRAAERNGIEHTNSAVTQIGTLGTYKPKAAIKAAARGLNPCHVEGMDPAAAAQAIKDSKKLGDKLSNTIPKGVKLPSGSKMTLDNCFKELEALRKEVNSNPMAKEVFDQAKWLEGRIANFGVHAAAVVIGDRPMEWVMPLRRSSPNDPIVTSFEQDHVEDIGALKQDFLGLRNLDVIAETLSIIRETEGIDITDPWDEEQIPLDDPKTYEILSRGDTEGLFQVESGGMKSALRAIQPTQFSDIIAIVALYRPGPMDYIPIYARRKHGQEKVIYPDERVKDILEETFGICVYQEQAMLIARALAGFTPGQADDLRKAIGKKKMDKMALLETPYKKGCKENGVPKEVYDQLWADNEKAGDYQFNKAHAACYGLITYATAYLKANYPAAYMSAIMTSLMSSKDKLVPLLNACKKMGIRVLPPDVNRSHRGFSIHEQDKRYVAEHGKYEIFFGLTAISGIGGPIVDQIRSERENGGPFRSIYDLMRRVPQLNKSQLEALVKAGALDCTGDSRKSMCAVIEPTKNRLKKERDEKQKSFIKSVREQFASSDPNNPVTLDLFGGEKALGNVRLDSGDSKACEVAAKLVFNQDEITDEELREATHKGLLSNRLSKLRAQVKNQHKMIDKDEVEEIVTELINEEETELEERVNDLTPRIAGAIKAAKRAEHEFMGVDEEESANDLESALAEVTSEDPPLSKDDWTLEERLNHEYHAIGIYASGHPLDETRVQWARYVSVGLGELNGNHIGRKPTLCGVITSVNQIMTRFGSYMYKVGIDDPTGSQTFVCFEDNFPDEEPLEILKQGNIITAKSWVNEDTFAQNNDDEEEDVEGLEDIEGEKVKEVDESERAIQLKAFQIRGWHPEQIDDGPIRVDVPKNITREEYIQLQQIVKSHEGNDVPVIFIRYTGEEKDMGTVKASTGLLRDLRRVVGSIKAVS